MKIIKSASGKYFVQGAFLSNPSIFPQLVLCDFENTKDFLDTHSGLGDVVLNDGEYPGKTEPVSTFSNWEDFPELHNIKAFFFDAEKAPSPMKQLTPAPFPTFEAINVTPEWIESNE